MPTETYRRWRYRLVPDHVLGEILAKSWVDTAIPFLFLFLTLVLFGTLIPNLLYISNLTDLSRTTGEYLLIGVGLTIVVVAGGIDLSVGSVFALANLMTIALSGYLGLPLAITIPLVLAAGGLIGLVTGVLIGYFRLRAFLTTLVMLIIVRGLVDALLLSYSTVLGSKEVNNPFWDFLAYGDVLSVSPSFLFACLIAILAHVFLTRLRPGWNILAVGGSRRAAFNIGLDVRFTICSTYVMSAVLAAAAGIFYAARLASLGSDTGVGLELTLITAVVLGGTSLGGGRGSIFKTVLGVIIIVIITNGLIRLGLRSGASPMALGVILLAGVGIDVRWMKNRHKVLARAYASPTYFKLPALRSTERGSDSPYALNDILNDAEAIGAGQLDGPEDVIFDRSDYLYCSSRDGDIIRFQPPDYERAELYAHIGGTTLGLAMDKDENVVVCVPGMGLYKVTPNRQTVKLSDEVKRSMFSIVDDSRLRIADDVDIAPDGRIYFSEPTVRYEVHDWIVDAVEGRRSGRIICYDPRRDTSRTVLAKLHFPNGICMVGDGESLLFAETWGCRVMRYWFAGKTAGKVQVVIADLPGYPDNINRASDGNFWLGIVGMRSPAFDLAQRHPDSRRRMVMRVSRDEWLFPNMNAGGVVKFDLGGRIIRSLWDSSRERHPSVTSMREHKGYLYLGGIYSDRIGRIKLRDCDPTWTSFESYWGARK